MEKELKEYHDAMNAHLAAIEREVISKDEVRKTRYRLLTAKEDMRAREREILEDNPRKLYESDIKNSP